MTTRQPLPLVLASASPRRADLLREAGIEFERRPSDIDESRLPDEEPERYVVRLAAAKARAGWRRGTLALGADTVVVLDGTVFCKPRDAAEAKRMLASLSGRWHRVLTGVAVHDGRLTRTACEETRVELRNLSPREIDTYVRSGEPLDKAGAYAIQGGAGIFVARIEGSRSNVVGLPLERVAAMIG